MKRKEKRNSINGMVLGLALLILGMCMLPAKVRADQADLSVVSFIPWFKAWEDGSSEMVNYLGTAGELKPFIIQYGTKTITLPAQEVHLRDPDHPNFKYYLFRMETLEENANSQWMNGATIKLVSVPAPDGYVVCFSGQPELKIGRKYDSNYVDCMIPLVKEGQKVDISSNSSFISCVLEEENGQDVICVYHNTIPLTEGADYKITKDTTSGFYRYVTITGMGNYTGSKTTQMIVSNPGPSDGTQNPSDQNSDSNQNDNSNSNTGSGTGNTVTLKKGDTFYSGNYRYRITKVSGKKGNVTVIGLKNKKTSTVSLPNTVKKNGYTFTVTAVGTKAFKNNTYIKKVTTNKALRTIGAEAFYKCTSLTSVKISSGVTTIGKKAFYGCKKLKTLSLPNTLTTIGDDAFYLCASIRTLSIPKGVKTIGKAAFARCTSLTKVTIPTTVRTIKSKAFYGNKKLKTVRIYSAVIKTAGSKCFGGISSKAVIKVPAKKVAAYKKLLKVKNVRK